MNRDFEGYSNEIDYTFGYYPLLSPIRLRLACLNQSITFPSHRPLRYLELGHGNGVSLNIHAAACPGEYWGTDINPSHVDFSKKLAQAAGSGVRALDTSLFDLLNYPDLPNFDLIVIHGVWSYISEANRNAIIDLLQQKLVEGGVFHLSYNAMPGSSGIVPLQHLLRLYSEIGGNPGTPLDRIQAGIAFASQLRDAGSKFFVSIPKASERLERIKSQDPVYLVHEYLHEFWHVPSFAQTAASLSKAGLRFASSANLMDHYEDLDIKDEGLALLASLDDPLLRETARDFLRDRQFRQDIFVKGKEPDPLFDREDIIEDLSVILAFPEVEIPVKIKTQNGPISLSEAPFGCAVTALAADGNRAKKVRELVERCRRDQVAAADVARAIMILISVGIVHPVQDDLAIQKAVASCRRLNAEILRQSCSGTPLPALASPVTGCGIRMSQIQQLCLVAYQAGAKDPAGWARFALDVLTSPAAKRGARDDPEKWRGRVLREALSFQIILPIYSTLGLVALSDS